MKIIASTTDGYIIEASCSEVYAILSAVTGKHISKADVEIDQKIPAIDYASTIRKVKALGETSDFKGIFHRIEAFVKEAEKLQTAVDNAKNLEI